MKSRLRKRKPPPDLPSWHLALPWVALAALLVVLLIHTWNGQDIWYHLNLGRLIWERHEFQPAGQFLMEQRGFHNFYWLYQLAAFGLFRLGGIPVVSAATGCIWFAIGCLWFRAVRPARAGGVGLALALLTLITCQSRFEVRPEIPALAILFAQILIVQRLDWSAVDGDGKRARARGIALLLGSQVLLANVHGYFAFGPAFIALHAGSAALFASGRRPRILGMGALAALGMALAACVSPFGWGGWQMVVEYSRDLYLFRDFVVEAQPLPLRHAGDAAIWLLVAGTGFCAAATLLKASWSKPEDAAGRLFGGALALLGVALSLGSSRSAPFLVLFAVPMWAELLDRRAARSGHPVAGIAFGALFLLLAAGVVEGSVYRYLRVSKRFGFGVAEAVLPVRATPWIAENAGDGVIFNDPDFGGYLAWSAPGLRLYSDSRYVDPVKVREYMEALSFKESFDRLDGVYHFDYVVLGIASSMELASKLMRDPGWTLVYADLLTGCWARKPRSTVFRLQPIASDLPDVGPRRLALWQKLLPDRAPAAICPGCSWPPSR